MSIEGNINTVDLASVFQMLFNNRREGVLIVDGPEKKHIHFSSGGVSILSPPQQFGAQVGLSLLRERKITPDQLADWKQEAFRNKTPLFDILCREVQDFNQDDQTRIYGRIVEEDLCEVLSWGKAKFQFHSGTSPDDFAETVMSVPFVISDIDWIVLESVRRMDEWTLIKRMIPSTEEIYRSAGQAPARSDEIGGDNGRLIYSLVDGQNSVDEIIEASYLTKFEVCRTLAHFLEDGVVIPIPLEELTSRAAEFHKRNRLDDALKFQLRAVARNEEDLDLRIKVADVYEKAKDLDEAAHHFRICAEQCLAAHRIDEAFKFYLRVAHLLPRDLDSREKLVDLYVEYGGDYDLKCNNLVEEGMSVASRLASLGEGERAIQLLRKLVGLKETNLSLRAQLINTSLKLGNAEEAISEYEDLARQFFQRGNLESAAKIYDKILTIDGSRKDIFEKLQNLEELIARRKSSRQRKRIFVYLAAGVAFLGVTFFLYYRASQRAYSDLNVAELVQGGKLQEAVAVLDSFQKNFPLSPIAFEAAEEHRRVLRMSQERVRARREAEQRALAELNELQDRALESVDGGDLPGALTLFREIAGKGDEAYLMRNRVLERIEEIDGYLTGARDVLTKAQELEQAADYRNAHLTYRKVLSEYPLSDVVRDVRLPFYVTSEPAGAMIVVDGEVTSLRTPSVVQVEPNSEIAVDLMLDGFRTERCKLDRGDQWLQEVVLQRAPLWMAETGGPITGPCEVDETAVFVGNRGAKVTAHRLRDGKELWARQLPGIADVEGGARVKDGVVYVGANDMMVRALDRGTGDVLWKVRTDGFVKSRPLALERHLIVGSSSGKVYGLARSDGRELWTFQTDGEVTSGPLFDGDTVYIGTSRGVVHSLDPKTGKEQAVFRCQDAVRSEPVITQRMMVCGADDGQIYAFDLFSGRPRWKFPSQGPVRASLVVRGLKLYFGSDDGFFYCLDVETGQLLSRYEVGSPVLGACAFGERRLYVAGESGTVHALDPTTLQRAWQTRVQGEIAADLTVTGGSLLVPCLDGKLFAFLDEPKKIQ